MITPSQCKSLWKQFKAETEFTITQAVSTQVRISYNRALISPFLFLMFDFTFCLSLQQAHRRGNSKLPPPWAIAAIAILGFNEIMVVLRYFGNIMLCAS